MGVFENTYLPNYQKAIEQIQTSRSIQDQNFNIIYLTTVINTFKWGNIPKKMPPQFIEESLQFAGRVGAIMRDGELKIFPAFPAGGLTEYGEFDAYTIISRNGKSEIIKASDIEICFNSCLKIPYYYMIASFAENGSIALRSVYSQLNRSMKPTIISCKDESQLKIIDSLRGENSNMKEFAAVMGSEFGENGINKISLFDNRESDVLALWDVYVRQRNLFYSTFGINNVEITKKERLTQAEGSGNDEIVRYTLLDDMLSMRKDFVSRVKEHFGYNLSIELNRDSMTVFEMEQTNDEKIDSMKIAITKGSNISQSGNNLKEGENNADKIE